MNNIIEALNWRYATKRMNGTKIPQEKLNVILESIRLSPSALGIQPYSVLVIEDEKVKSSLKKACFNQPQIEESSAVIVFAAWKDYSNDRIEEYINLVSSERAVSLDSLKDYKTMIESQIKNSKENNYFDSWASKQCYIGLGFALYTAALENIDATPMEGFMQEAVDKLLGLEAKGLTTSVVCTLGNRDAANDYMVNAKKVRRHSDDFFIKK